MYQGVGQCGLVCGLLIDYERPKAAYTLAAYLSQRLQKLSLWTIRIRNRQPIVSKSVVMKSRCRKEVMIQKKFALSRIACDGLKAQPYTSVPPALLLLCPLNLLHAQASSQA